MMDPTFKYPYQIGDLIQRNHFGSEDVGLVLEVRFTSGLPKYKKEYYNYTVYVLNLGTCRNWIHFKNEDDFFLVSEVA